MTDDQRKKKCYWVYDGEQFILNPEYVTPKKKHKFNAKRTWYKGEVFDSLKEANVLRRLELKKSRGMIVGFERQVLLPLVVNGKKISKIIVDFKVEHLNGSFEYIDAKGINDKGKVITMKPDFRLKMKLVEALYGFKINII
jgi:hypothetical protein